MGDFLQKFLPNEAHRRLFPGFLCFCIGAFGVALGFGAWALEWRWLGYLAYGITTIGVFGGGCAILYGWWRIANGPPPHDK